MPIAVECPDGHKRHQPDLSVGQEVNCPDSDCRVAFRVPIFAHLPHYQPERLERYNPAYRDIVRDLFEQRQRRIRELAQITQNPGSYSILASGGSQERVGKIVVYQRDVGTRSVEFPDLEDGVYIFIRANGEAAGQIWTAEVVDLVFPQFFSLMRPNHPLRVLPSSGDERFFTYFRVNMPQDQRLHHPYLEQIALLLETCSSIC